MAINDLPTPTDSKPGLRSYREAASFLVENERLSRGESRPLEPCEPKSSPRPCGSPPRYRSSSSRCRTRTPSPPQQHPSSSSRGESKAPRSVSPGGTPATSAGAALRRRDGQGQPAPSPRRLRVRWANSLVESVRTRPRTLRKDVSSLFYSRADEKRFRREAERAREVEDEWCEALEEDSLTSLDDVNESSEHKPLWSPQRERRDYAISKAVVVFGNATRTYGGGAGAGCAIEAALESQGSSSFSFDDAAFWNGQLTWS